MNVERTLTLVKPDGLCKQLTGTILERFQSAGLRLLGLRMLRLTPADAERFAGEHKGKTFYGPLIKFMVSAPIVAAVWEGKDAITQVRALMGATNSPEAAPSTLRRQHGVDNRYNLVHGSDSAASAEREISFFFKPEDVFQYRAEDWQTENLERTR